MIAAYLIATIAMATFILLTWSWIATIARVGLYYLLTIIVVASIVGSCALDSTTMSLWVMLVFGVLGFTMERFGYPLAPFAIALVLTLLLRQNFVPGCKSRPEIGARSIPRPFRRFSLDWRALSCGFRS